MATPVEIRPVDLGPCRGYVFEPEGAEGAAILLPGSLLGGMPAQGIVTTVLLARRLRIVQVWDEFLDRTVDATAWARERATAALTEAGDRPGTLVVAKSLTTRAAGLAAERALPAIWLTPLLSDEACVAMLRERTAPAMLVGGTGDPMWDAELARELSDDVLELPGADHGFGAPDGSANGLLQNLRKVADGVDAFVAALG